MKNQDRYRSGRFKKNVYICGSCGSHSEGALSRDIHNASHMVIRPKWYWNARALANAERDR